MEIRTLAYKLYILDWKQNRMISREEEKSNVKEYFKYINKHDLSEYSYEDFLYEYGYFGTMYACFEEFLKNEYKQ